MIISGVNGIGTKRKTSRNTIGSGTNSAKRMVRMRRTHGVADWIASPTCLVRITLHPAGLHTTAGPIPLSLFATQTPLTCRNFLQHSLDGYYDGVLVHRIAAGFVIQTGDPSGTGEGGENIYEDKEFERYDKVWAKLLGREEREKIVFKDEVHSRLKFNRRGLLGMAKQSDGGYGSQFFITTVATPWLDGKHTIFGEVVEGMDVVLKISEAPRDMTNDMPLKPIKINHVTIIRK